jgi:serine protease Do
VTEVKPDSFAEELGVEAGDLVLSINRQTVTSVEEFDRLQAQLKSGMDVVLLVARQNEGTYTTLFLADRLP